jgi:hypothetical protein
MDGQLQYLKEELAEANHLNTILEMELSYEKNKVVSILCTVVNLSVFSGKR